MDILIVSGNDVFSRMLGLYLSRHGYSYKTASLPSFDGFRLLLCDLDTSASALSVGLSVPVIGFTVNPEKLPAGIREDCTLIKTRPFSCRELCGDIGAILGGGNSASGDLPSLNAKSAPKADAESPTLCLRGRTAVFGEKTVALTANEAAILTRLIEADGAAVGKAALRVGLCGKSGSVRSDNTDNFGNVVEVYISTLRKKLSRLSMGIIIGNIRGEGYKLTVL